MTETSGYILTEIWRAKPSWMSLSVSQRERYFEEVIGPFIGSQIDKGAEFLGCAVNDNDGSERIDYRYMAVWKLPNREFSEKLELGSKAAGFLEYFEQVNFSGSMISPSQLNADMIELQQ
jgi:hypothetical protein